MFQFFLVRIFSPKSFNFEKLRKNNLEKKTLNHDCAVTNVL